MILSVIMSENLRKRIRLQKLKIIWEVPRERGISLPGNAAVKKARRICFIASTN